MDSCQGSAVLLADVRLRSLKVLPVTVALHAAAAAPLLTPEQTASVRAEYQKLSSAVIEAHPAAALPQGERFERIDVSQRLRSASFGHKTWLAVRVTAADAGPVEPVEFWVEYGKSTNYPARLFGPFALPVKPE
jgi:hypothetical protein